MNFVERHQPLPKVSIIVPLYNKEKYVARALDSIFAQTYQEFEIMVVDDGSSDKGPEIVRSYSDRRLRLVYQDNSGPGGARNRGIRESTAQLLAFLDADDEWLPEFLQQSIERLQGNADCMLTIAGRYWGPERINREQIYRKGGVGEGPWRLQPDVDVVSLKFALDFFWSPAIVCWRQVVEQFGGFYEKNRCNSYEDAYLWLQVALNCKVDRHPTPLAWWHTETSELAIGRKTEAPPMPMLTDPEPIRNSCPPDYRDLLERFLAWLTLDEAKRLARAGDSIVPRLLLRKYPLVRTFGRGYTRTKFYVFLAPVFQLLKSVSWFRDLIRFLRKRIQRGLALDTKL